MKKGIVIIIGCLVLCMSMGGCWHGEVGREGVACDSVVKDADVFARDLGKCGGGGEKSITPSDGSEPRHVTDQKFAK